MKRNENKKFVRSRTVLMQHGARQRKCCVLVALNSIAVVLPDAETRRVRDALYTACKTGDADALNRVLEDIETEKRTERGSETHELSLPGADDSKLDTAPPSDTKSDDLLGQDDTSDNVQGKSNDPPPAEALLNAAYGAQQQRLLHLAAAQGHKSLIYRLLEAGADPALRCVKPDSHRIYGVSVHPHCRGTQTYGAYVFRGQRTQRKDTRIRTRVHKQTATQTVGLNRDETLFRR